MTAHHSLRLAASTALALGIVFSPSANADAINGAIYTSRADGTTVNANLYDSKDEVYLNGGPNNYPGCNGGDLDDGDYYFQVTNPSGSVLLSDDGIEERKFRVAAGKISENLGTHPVATPAASCGSLAIQLMPYDDTPNNGGEYKVWITRTSDFAAACYPQLDCGTDGFRGGSIKTDNFKVRLATPPSPPVTGSVRAFKFYDANANGLFDNNGDAVLDPGEDPLLDGWQMTLESLAQAANSTRFTTAGSVIWDGLMPDIDYTVEEGIPLEANWVHSATIHLGHDGSPVNPAGPLAVVAGATTRVLFGNYCTIPSNGRTLGFWSNRNGQGLIGDDDLQVLYALNLRKADGSHFDNFTKAQLRTWLLDGDAVNMAYMLSVQLAAMRLNVHNGFVTGGYYVPAGMTVAALMDAANASLALYGSTPAGHPQRADQAQLKDWLDALNNGAGLLSPTACDYSFP